MLAHRTAAVSFLLISLVFVCAGPTALAQRDLGTIVGVVTDASGGVIASAKVTITEDATGLKFEAQTDNTGTYVRPALKPGVYTVEVEMSGFKKGVQRNVSVTGGDRVRVDISLQVGEIAQAVEVTAAPPQLQSESTIIGSTLQARQVGELPLAGQRKFTFLAHLSPAVVPAEPGARDMAGGGFSANGVRSNGQNNFLLNGVDNNVNVIDFINQTAYVVGPSVEAIGEMKVLTNGYNAEYGRGAGGVVNITLKSGTNEIHGSVFEFLQNDKLDANKWENNRAGVRRGAFRQNQFGAAVGGPIKKDRAFWFADYQGTRIRSTGGAVPGLGNTFIRTIPWPEFKSGDFSRLLTGSTVGTDALGRPVAGGGIFDIRTNRLAPNGQLVRDQFPNNRIPALDFDPAAKRIIDLYPNPNQNLSDRIASNNFIVVTSGRQQNDQADARVDYRLTEKDTLFGSLSWSEEDKFNQSPFPGPLDAAGFAGESETNQGRNAMLSWVRLWSPRVITETRLAFSRLITQRTQANADKNLFKEFGIGGLDATLLTDKNGGLPTITMDGYSQVGAGEWLPTLEYSNVWDFIQNVSISKSGHAFKFGFEYRPIGFPFFQVPSPHGTMRFNRNRTQHPQFTAATGDGIAGWLLGFPSPDTRITTANFISSEKVAYAWYFQDDWKITPKLTLNLGLRYELFSPIGEKFGRQSTLDLDRQTLVIPKGPNQDDPLPPNFGTALPNIKVERGSSSKYLIGWDKTDLSPRIGLAYQPWQNMVIRAGYGIFYGGEENQGGNPNRGESVPFNQEVRFPSPTAFDRVPALGRFSDGFPLNSFTLPATIAFRGVSPNFRNPLVHKWNFAVQRELGWNTALEVSYIGSTGSRLLILWDPNQPLNVATPGAAPLPRRQYGFLVGDTGIQQTSTFGFSNYHALATKLEKRYSNGLDFLLAYTWGHGLTNVGTTLAGGPGVRDIRNISAEYAHANFHIKHRFVYSAIYDLPFGRGRKYGANWSGAANALLGNWQVNGVLTLQTGNAFNLGTRNASCGCGGTVRPDLVSGKNPNDAPSGGRTPDLWLDRTAVTAPAPGTFGTLGHYSNYGPGIHNVDFSLFKDFRLTERFSIQFRSEFFNLFNSPQFNVQTIDATEGNSGFGRIGGTLPGTERHVQFALRLRF